MRNRLRLYGRDFIKPAHTRLLVISVILSGTVGISSGATVIIGQNYTPVQWGTERDVFTNGWKNVDYNAQCIFKPNFIENTKPYHIHRFMNWQHASRGYCDLWNGETYRTPEYCFKDSTWLGRKKYTDKDQALLAFEYQIDLCNRTNASGWFHTNIRVSYDYATRMAIFLKTGVDMLDIDLSSFESQLATMTPEDFTAKGGVRTSPGLNSNLKIYLEMGNETWLFEGKELEDKGKKMGFPTPTRESYHAYLSALSFAGFERVFGKNSSRVVKIIAGQAGNPWVGQKRLEAFYSKNPKINPYSVEKIDAYAIATYWGKSPSEERSKWLEHKAIASKNGVALMFYEGGNGGAGPNGGSGVGATKDPAMYKAYQDYFKILEDVGFTAGCHHNHCGGEWSTLPSVDLPVAQAMEYSKYKALTEYMAKIPKEPVSIKGVPGKLRGVTSVAARIGYEGKPVFNFLGRVVKAQQGVDIKQGIYFVRSSDNKVAGRINTLAIIH